MYDCEVEIIPYVMTWDGIVTCYHDRRVEQLGLSKRTEAYIQTRVIKMTLESMTMENRRDNLLGEDRLRQVAIEMQKLESEKVSNPRCEESLAN